MPRPTSTRREFLIAGAVGAAGISAAALGLTRRWDPATVRGASEVGPGSNDTRTLVLVTMYGGNDGLNTVVPASDPAYQAARPTLGYQPDQLLELADGVGLNPKLTNLANLWKHGQLAVVQGVGYPEPNLSHFDSMDIWQTANPQLGTGPGWLGTWLDGDPGDPLRAVSIGPTVPTALRGRTSAAAALTSTSITLAGSTPQQLAYTALVKPGADRSGLAATCPACGSDLLASKAELDGLHIPIPSGQAARPAGAGSLSDQLEVVAALIRAEAPGKVYQVSLSSFDTHADEKTAHEEKLAELDAGIGSFFSSLQGASRAAGTVLLTYSEFGRRVAQNASGGTDHGAAAPLFVVGPGVKGGKFYGDQPSLTALDPNGNLIYNVDFRSVYATMLDQVVGVDPARILGGKFPTLDLV